jgi:predicted nucleotide-binding protein
MAINTKDLEFLLEKLENSDFYSFSSSLRQLNNYLSQNVKDNPIYDFYNQQAQCYNIPEIIENLRGKLPIPEDLEGAKIFSYAIYKHASFNYNGDAGYFPDHFMGGSNKDDAIFKFNDLFFGHLKNVCYDILRANPEIDDVSLNTRKGNLAFIIHGHNDKLKMETQLLMSRAGINAIVLHEQADMGRTIIDKLIEEGKEANYAIGLLTPDDVLDNGDTRARQNVIFELGYFIGKLGKERVRLIVDGDIEIPSDLQGVIYGKKDESGSWKIKLIKEMMAVGIFADLEAIIKVH